MFKYYSLWMINVVFRQTWKLGRCPWKKESKI